MRRAWFTITVGALLLVAGVTGRVVVPEHKPISVSSGEGSLSQSLNPITVSSGSRPWSQTLYDVLSIATWVALIVGTILVLLGLINDVRGSIARAN